MDTDDEFYEDDESLEKIQAIRNRAPDSFTRKPVRGVTLYLTPTQVGGRWETSQGLATRGAVECR